MRFCGLLFSLSLLVAGAVHAQERSAVGAIDTQMTWSALSSQIGAVKGTTDGLVVQTNQSIACGKTGMVYGPGVAGATGAGCYQPATAPTVTTNIANLQTALGQTNTALNATTANANNALNNVNTVKSCAASGYLFNGSACVAATGSGARPITCTMSKVAGTSCPGVAINEAGTVHYGGGGSSNGTGSSSIGAIPYCIWVTCHE